MISAIGSIDVDLNDLRLWDNSTSRRFPFIAMLRSRAIRMEEGSPVARRRRLRQIAAQHGRDGTGAVNVEVRPAGANQLEEIDPWERAPRVRTPSVGCS